MRRSFTSLVRPHLDAMYRAAWRWTRDRDAAEDLVQDVLVRLVERDEKLDGIERLRPWLVKVLYRRYVDVYRRERDGPVDWAAEPPAHAPLQAVPSDDPAGELGLRRALEQALYTLPEEQRDTVLLHDVEGYTAAEVADILDVSPGTVKSRLHRARDKLKSILDDGTI